MWFDVKFRSGTPYNEKLTYVVEVEQDSLFGVARSLQVSDSAGLNVPIQLLLLNNVAGGNGHIEHGHTRTLRLGQIRPPEKIHKQTSHVRFHPKLASLTFFNIGHSNIRDRYLQFPTCEKWL